VIHVDGTQSRFDISDLAYCAPSERRFSGVGRTDDKAGAALRGDGQVLAELASSLIRVERDNLVERPWGGDWLKRFKRIPKNSGTGSLRWGESFEISAFDSDDEAARFPSGIHFDDGSRVDLPVLLEAQADALLGSAFVGRHGARFPLLPKMLDVKELLSVQGHPAGHTEAYIIIDAEPGATLRLGFNRDIVAAELISELRQGIKQQEELLERLGSDTDAEKLQQLIASWFATRDADAAAFLPRLDQVFPGCTTAATESLLAELKGLYWRVLDSMNAIEARPGQVIYNATPKRLLSDNGGVASAEVHALGNPEGLEILALEIRRPGPTFRAWDNVRFPKREVDIAAAINALNLRATRPEEFFAQRHPVPGHDGVFVSVDCEYFRVEHLMPDPGCPINVPESGPHSLHCLGGEIQVSSHSGHAIGCLERGESALVPVGVGAYRVDAAARADVVRVTLPED